MPTGYTADVGEGKVTDFSTFALTCARAFGALILMRDDPLDAPIPDEFKPSEHYAERVAEARKDLAALELLSDVEIRECADRDYAKAMKSWRDCCDEKNVTRARYKAMLVQVRDWTPPTPDHEGLRDFMLTQLTESIQWDCTIYDEPKRQTADEWLASRRQCLERDVAYYAQSEAEEIERAAQRTKWVRALRESLTERTTR